jgi:hypothetical protein
LVEKVEPSELLKTALSSLNLSDSDQRTVYRRAICLIARRVRHASKLLDAEPKRADLRDALQSAQQNAEALVQALNNADIAKALRLVGYREVDVERIQRSLNDLTESLTQSTTALRLSGRGNSRPWGFVEATPKELLILLCGRLFAHARNIEKQPHEETAFLDFVAPVWELATGRGGQDFSRQVDNTKEIRPANLIALLEGDDLVGKIEKALLRRPRTQFARTHRNTVRYSSNTHD